MNVSPFIIPLAVFAMVVLIVAIVQLTQIHDLETRFHQRLHRANLEHQAKMQELDAQLERIKQGLE